MTSDQSVWELSTSDCWARLRSAPVGRLAVVVLDRPEIFPVTFVVDRGSVVFRTAAGTKLAASAGRPVAFEVDGLDDSGEAWSVVLHGVAHELTGLHESVDALDLPLHPWHAAPKPRILRIEPERLSGRRFRPERGRDARLGRRSAAE